MWILSTGDKVSRLRTTPVEFIDLKEGRLQNAERGGRNAGLYRAFLIRPDPGPIPELSSRP